MKADCERSERMPECAGSTIKSDASKVVPAPTKAGCERSEQMPECAGTYRKAAS